MMVSALDSSNFFWSVNTFLTEETFVNSVDQDQSAQNVQSDLWFTLSTFFFNPEYN